MHPPPINTRTTRHNLLFECPGSKGNVRNVNVAIEALLGFYLSQIILFKVSQILLIFTFLKCIIIIVMKNMPNTFH
jgi:hypothetical protein